MSIKRFSAVRLALCCLGFLWLGAEPAYAQLKGDKPFLNKREMLQRFDFWDNQDWEWYEETFPSLNALTKTLRSPTIIVGT